MHLCSVSLQHFVLGTSFIRANDDPFGLETLDVTLGVGQPLS